MTLIHPEVTIALIDAAVQITRDDTSNPIQVAIRDAASAFLVSHFEAYRVTGVTVIPMGDEQQEMIRVVGEAALKCAKEATEGK